MKKVLRFFASILILALLVLWGLSYLEAEEADKPVTGMLNGLLNAGREFGKNVDRFLDETGIKQGAANILEKSADMLRGGQTPAPNAPKVSEQPEATPFIVDEGKDFV